MSDRPLTNDAPESPFPLLPLRNGVLFPGTVTTLAVGRPQSLALLRQTRPGQSIIGVAIQKDSRIADPSFEDLQPVGTFARVVGIQRHGENAVMLSLQGLSRFKLNSLVETQPHWLAEGTALIETVSDEAEATQLSEALRQRITQVDTQLSSRLGQPPAGETPARFADRVASSLELPPEKAMEVLSTADVLERLRLVTSLVGEALTKREVRQKIDEEVRKELSKNQRETVLREQMRAIRRELGEDSNDQLDALREKLEQAGLTEEAKKVVQRELRRLENLNSSHAEANVIRNYLEVLADLPWSARSDVKEDIDAVAAKLDEDHFGLKDAKQRILEHLAVLKVAKNPRGTILCLAGPPGVGKTSIGQSIADATGRPFVRIALGGVRDEAEIRGHRRTYIGAMPGRIINALKRAKVKNPVILLDEIDKVTHQSWNGSPESALLEVLDPEQNHTFSDHYVEVPFDLSEALFICTANNLENISAPLRDRLEIVEVSGYTREEKVKIARQHLLPRQLKDHGLHEESLQLSDDALTALVRDYTREAGVRQLNRELVRLCRNLALRIARSPDAATTLYVTPESLYDILGKPKFREDLSERIPTPGVAIGLAWTPVGGDILFIETSLMPGKGNTQITGKLGEVMTESARAALTYVRSHAEELDIDPTLFESKDLHIHVPAGAVPKDGPSAGVTIFTAIASLLTKRPVRTDTAMTGEATLRGRVLPVGGIKEKVLAAHRMGITRIILPKQNERDLEDIPEETRAQMQFFPVEDMREALKVALEGSPLTSSSLTGHASDGAVLSTLEIK